MVSHQTALLGSNLRSGAHCYLDSVLCEAFTPDWQSGVVYPHTLNHNTYCSLEVWSLPAHQGPAINCFGTDLQHCSQVTQPALTCALVIGDVDEALKRELRYTTPFMENIVYLEYCINAHNTSMYMLHCQCRRSLLNKLREWVSNACRLPGAKHDTLVTYLHGCLSDAAELPNSMPQRCTMFAFG